MTPARQELNLLAHDTNPSGLLAPARRGLQNKTEGLAPVGLMGAPDPYHCVKLHQPAGLEKFGRVSLVSDDLARSHLDDSMEILL
jgi:hypothetical protein